MATTLWPIIHRLSDLPSLKRELDLALQSNAPESKIAVLRTDFESTADAIEVELSQWEPHLPPNFVPDGDDPTLAALVGEDSAGVALEDTAKQLDDTTVPPHPTSPGSITTDPSPSPLSATERARLHSILHNALAYRHSAFVYLYRTIYAYPRAHDAVQTHAHLALVHCVSTVAYAGPMGALLWPLFAAACEAVSAEDRKLADQAFAAIRKRQGMMNIERAWEIVQEVWRRADWADVVADLGKGEGERDKSLHGESYTHVGDCLSGDGWRSAGARNADLWRQVSKEMGVNIVFG